MMQLRQHSLIVVVISILVMGSWLSCCRVLAAPFNKYVPVYVMMNLDWINTDNTINNKVQLISNLTQLKGGDVDGINVDVWWGIVEYEPGQYNWSSYLELAQICQNLGLKMQMIMSFHTCGGNVGDGCDIPLPSWVLEVGNSNPDIWYRDQQGHWDTEYLSLGVDNEPLFPPNGRTPLQIYGDYMKAFASAFSSYLGSTITEVQVGLGPAGEMRYPSYQLQYWTFPGVGEFQCYDKYMLAQLQQAASQAGQPEWGVPPSNASTYNSSPNQTEFFNPDCTGSCNNYKSQYGQFFLFWYANALISHGDAVLSQAASIFGGIQGLAIAAKVAGIHWLYDTPSHAAELTAGYKNDLLQGYTPIAQMFAKYGVVFDFTCLEMTDQSQPPDCYCAPVELVGQTETDAVEAGIPYAGENALPVFDTASYQQIEYEADRIVHPIASFTYLRLCNELLEQPNWGTFTTFVQNMHNLL